MLSAVSRIVFESLRGLLEVGKRPKPQDQGKDRLREMQMMSLAKKVSHSA